MTVAAIIRRTRRHDGVHRLFCLTLCRKMAGHWRVFMAKDSPLPTSSSLRTLVQNALKVYNVYAVLWNCVIHGGIAHFLHPGVGLPCKGGVLARARAQEGGAVNREYLNRICNNDTMTNASYLAVIHYQLCMIDYTCMEDLHCKCLSHDQARIYHAYFHFQYKKRTEQL